MTGFRIEYRLCFPFSQESGWPLYTRILKTAFVFVVKQKRETKIFLENPFMGPSRKRKLGFGYHFLFSLFARNVKSKTNIKFSWPLGTRILKSVFVVVVKRNHEIGISSKIHFLVLHANGFWKSNDAFCFRVFAKKRLALGYAHSDRTFIFKNLAFFVSCFGVHRILKIYYLRYGGYSSIFSN